ncbi:MAG: hypothetical protein IPM23_26535 [Candidatus Melainabacteria bacterium]|nr:hypothetical protein [Candidatus Melainabacteria bacterium]
MIIQRAQWPHTIADIVKTLDGVWGVVGATGTNGNLYRLERSLKEPVVYTLIEYRGDNESEIVEKRSFDHDGKQEAIDAFASALGFHV